MSQMEKLRKKTCNNCGKKGHSSRNCRSNPNNQNNNRGGARRNGTRGGSNGSRSDDNESSLANVECILSNFDDEFSFPEFDDTSSYDGNNYSVIEEVDNNDFLFPSGTIYEQAFLHADLPDVCPVIHVNKPKDLDCTNAYGAEYAPQSMINILNQDNDDNYTIEESDDDNDNDDDDSNGSMPGLQDRTYDDDSSSDEDSTTADSIPSLITYSDPVNNGDDSDDDSFNDVPTYNENNKTTVQENEPTVNAPECEELTLTNALMSFPASKKLLLLGSIGIEDSGSTTHSSGSLRGADNIIDAKSDSGTTDASGNNMKVSEIFDLTCAVNNRFGESKGNVKFSRVRLRYSKNKPFTLISITKIMKKGFKLSGKNNDSIIFKKDTQQIVFDIPIRTTKGVLWCISLQRLNPHTGTKAAFAQVTYNITQAHSILGHMHEAMTSKVCKH